MTDIKRLRELEAKATPADEWELCTGEYYCTIRVGTAYISAPYQKPEGRGKCERQEADGALIVEQRNALPALLDELEAAMAEVTRLTEEVNGLRADLACWKFVPDRKGGHMFHTPTGSRWYPETAISAHAAAGKGDATGGGVG